MSINLNLIKLQSRICIAVRLRIKVRSELTDVAATGHPPIFRKDARLYNNNPRDN